MKKLLLSSLFIIPVVAMQEQALQIESPSLQYPSQLGSLKLYHHDNRFIIDDNGKHLEIQRCDIDPAIRTLPKEKLLAYLTTGYIRASKTNNGDIVLRGQQRIHGGGPVLAGIFYWGTKVVCYGTASAAASGAVAGAVVLTGGGAAAPVAAGTVAAAKAFALGSAVTGMGVASGAATAGVATGITVAGGTATAVGATASVMTGAGGIAGAIAAVESAACFMGAVGMAIPFL